ncbi:hypothetical protein KC939_02240 [Candidatus Saccharibacteria bacterium]|nr:hypothetical protein [Candidatus Saccharibacteria bacterium]
MEKFASGSSLPTPLCDEVLVVQTRSFIPQFCIPGAIEATLYINPYRCSFEIFYNGDLLPEASEDDENVVYFCLLSNGESTIVVDEYDRRYIVTNNRGFAERKRKRSWLWRKVFGEEKTEAAHSPSPA